jgi:hypothetical protein
MPVISSITRYNTTQRYFLISDFTITLFWFFIICRLIILYPLTGSKFLPGGIADFYINVLNSTVLLEIFNYLTIFRHIPNNQTINNNLQKPHFYILLIVSLIRLSLTFVIYNYPRITPSKLFSILILSQSLKELFRWFYNFQKVRLFNNNIPWLNKFLRSFTYLLLTPIETFSSFYLLFQSLIYPSYQNNLINYDIKIKFFLKLILILYLPIFYIIYKRTIKKYFFANSNVFKNFNKKHD